MTMIVLHANTYDSALRGDARLRDLRFEADDALVSSLLRDGLFVAVARMDGDDPERAWEATQNGHLADSWSRQAPAGIVPLGAGTVPTPDGEYGYRSSMMGDLVVVDGKVNVAVMVGFRELDVELPDPSAIPVIGGGTLADAPPAPFASQGPP